MSLNKKFVLVGPPGAGKGTVSIHMKSQYDIPYLSTGDIFRSEIKNGTELGRIADALISKGNFVPDDLTVEVVQSFLQDMHNYVLDGFPRNLNQANIFDVMLNQKKSQLDAVIHLYLDDYIIKERLIHRLVCPSCSANYHTKNVPPKKEGICDKCETKLIQRVDDKPEFIEKRLAIYHETTSPIIDFYKNKGILYSIDSNCSVEEMFEKLDKVVAQLS
jgi:adenylate kinase